MMSDEGIDMFKPGAGAGAPPPPSPLPPKEESGTGGFMGGLKVSLMPSGEGEDTASDTRRRLVMMLAVLIAETVIIGGAFLYVSGKEAKAVARRQELEATLAQVTQQIKESEGGTKAMTLFDSRVRIATELLDEHIYWTGFFDYLRGITKPSVFFLNFSGEHVNGIVTLDAMGPTYRDVAEQIVILREEPMIEEVITSSASATISETGEVAGVSFGLVLKIKPDVWAPSSAGEAPASEGGAAAVFSESPVSIGSLIETPAEDAGGAGI